MNDLAFKVKEDKVTENYGEFIIEPLQTGFGHTMGNSLRRVLLSAIAGAAITSVRINGVKHKFSTIPGVKENVVDLILNIKQLNVKLLNSRESATINISVKGPKDVTAADIEVSEDVEIVDKDQYICSLADKKAKLDVELTVEKGYGYSLSEERKATTLGVLTTDAIFSPIRRVNVTVSATRVGRQTNLDSLTLQIWTNGTVAPRASLDEAAKILSSYFSQVYEPKQGEQNVSELVSVNPSVSEDVLKLTIDELDLPTRIYNSLRNGGIEILGQLLATPRKEIMTMRNMGSKSIVIIEDKLKEKGISLSI